MMAAFLCEPTDDTRTTTIQPASLLEVTGSRKDVVGKKTTCGNSHLFQEQSSTTQ